MLRPARSSPLRVLNKPICSWELYNIREDFSQANDVAADNPEKLKEMQDLFLEEAVQHNVLPLDDPSPGEKVRCASLQHFWRFPSSP